MSKAPDIMAAAIQALERGDLSTLGNTQNGHGGESDGGDPIDAARSLLGNLDEQIQADVGAAFVPEVLDALRLVRQSDPSSWARAKQVLQKRHISVREVQQAITNRGTAGLPGDRDHQQG